MHGEMPTDFNPRVWWLVLGLNDLGRMQCSEEVVILGILRVVEEIRSRKPNAEIVINSMLPMVDFRGGVMPQMIDYKDAFIPHKGLNAKHSLYARASGVAGTAGGIAKVSYQRPITTTKALHNRNSGASRGKPIPVVVPGKPDEQVDGGDRQLKKKDKEKAEDKKEEAKAAKEAKKKEKEAVKEEKAKEKKEEAETKKEAKAERKFFKKVRKDPVNPKLKDVAKVKARDPKRLFLAKNRLPLWTSIKAINKQLQKFADSHEKIKFFDATDIFAERDEGNRYVLQSDKISIRGHPTLLGFQEWEEEIAKTLKKMFENADKELAKEAAEAEQAEKENAQTPASPVNGESSDGPAGEEPSDDGDVEIPADDDSN